jgi:hypothetical protein
LKGRVRRDSVADLVMSQERPIQDALKPRVPLLFIMTMMEMATLIDDLTHNMIMVHNRRGGWT